MNIVPYTVFGTLEWSQRAIQLRGLRVSANWSSLSQWRFCILVRMMLINNCIFWGETAITCTFISILKMFMWKICEILLCVQGKISGWYLPQWSREKKPGSMPGSAMEIIARSPQRTSHTFYTAGFTFFSLKCIFYSCTDGKKDCCLFYIC